MKYILYGHGTAYNHGAEAIVKTTVRMIKQCDAEAYIVLSTHFASHDREFGIDLIVDKLIEYDKTWLNEERQANGLEKKVYAMKMYREVLDEIGTGTICLGIGGDNYCYSNWHRQSIFHEVAKMKGAKSILWRCSINSEALTDDLQTILKQHDLIIARESATLEVLEKRGITNTLLLPDTAFHLELQKTTLPIVFQGENKVIGINLSPLILRYSNQEEKILENFVELIEYILKNTNFNICLIPHVTISVDDDIQALQLLYDVFKDNERVAFINQNLSAAEYKYIISHCYMMICARTHASIAAYSSRIPTLVIGYSIKSLGIAMDLNCLEYVIDAKLVTSDILICKFKDLQEHYEEVKSCLKSKMSSDKYNSIVKIGKIM